MNLPISQTTEALPIEARRGILYQIPRWLLAIVAAFAPTIATFGVIAGSLKRNLFDFRPAIWNDQTYYWHQILTFSRAGFNGGYYLFYEKVPALEFFHFGASGFLYPALYGTVAHFVGWEPYVGILLNLAILAIAVFLLIFIARFDQLQIVFTGLLLVSLSTILLFIPTISQESFHQAAAIILGIIFYYLLQRDGQVSWRFMAAGIVFFVVISLVRFSWILLLLPFFLLSRKKWTWQNWLFALVMSAVVAVPILLIFQSSSAPGNNSVFNRLGLLGTSPIAGLEIFWNTLVFNLKETFRVPDFRQFPFGIVQFFILLFGLLFAGRRFLNGNSITTSKQHYFHLYNLISILGASLILYLNSGYVRIFTPHIILSSVVLIAFKRFRLVSILMIVGLLGVGMFLKDYRDWFNNFIPYTPTQISQLKAPYEQYMVYDETATNPWCNTVLMSLQFLDVRSTFVPAGIGISFFSHPDLQPTPIKSQYVLLDDLSYSILHDRVKLAYLTSINGGKLYRNLDADCK